VTDENLTSIARVARSRPAKNIAARSAKIEAGIKLSKPGRRINKTPIKPTKTALQRRQPTFSLKNIAAPIVTNNGNTCKIAEADDSGVKAIARTKNKAPKSSHRVLTMMGVVNRFLWKIGAFVSSPINKNIMLPLNPRMMMISETGRLSESILINRSSNAKPAIASIINKAPFKLSISKNYRLKWHFNCGHDFLSTYLGMERSIVSMCL